MRLLSNDELEQLEQASTAIKERATLIACDGVTGDFVRYDVVQYDDRLAVHLHNTAVPCEADSAPESMEFVFDRAIEFDGGLHEAVDFMGKMAVGWVK